jgi:signal peptidase I
VTGAPIARRVAVLVLMAVGTAAMFRSVHRVEVVGDSMTPSLMPGDRLVVMSPPWWRPPWPVPGTVVAVRDPRLPQRLLIKRVVAVDRDSRTFGPVPRSLLVGRAVYRYAPAGRGVRGVW